MERKEAIKLFLEDAKKLYIEDQQAKGIRTSGESAKSLRTESNSKGGKLLGSLAFYLQLKNHTLNKIPPNRKFPPIEAIIKWIRDKGIDVDKFADRPLDGPKAYLAAEKSLAYIIGKKIKEKGTDIYQGKRPGLSIEDKMEELRRNLVKNIISAEKAVMIENIKNKLLAAKSA